MMFCIGCLSVRWRWCCSFSISTSHRDTGGGRKREEADTRSAGADISGDFRSRGDDASDYLHRDTGWKLFGGTLCICKLCQCGGVSHTLLMAAACELEADGQQEEIRHRHGSDL